MKEKWHYAIIAAVIVVWVMACGLPFTITAVGGPTATPDADQLAIRALATLLTPNPATETPMPTSTFTATATSTVTPTATETSTATSTATSTSTSTLAPLPARYAGFYYANHFWSAPTIDGVWDEWGGTVYNAGALIYGAGNWTGANDLSPSFRVGWDSNYLYIAAKVKDDVYAQNATGQDIYKGDSIEILLDSDLYSDFYTPSLNWDDYQLVISPGKGDINGPKEAVMYYPRAGNGDRNNVIIGSASFDGGYRVEAAIPWSDFGVTPFAGKGMGFAFSVSDNDDTTQNVQQSMMSSTSGRRLTNPVTWAELILGN
jgi:hypothetical protein